MVGHVESAAAIVEASTASASTLKRIDSMHSIASDTDTETDRRSNAGDSDVDIHHSVEYDGEVADKALSPGLWRTFREAPLLMLCVMIGSMNFICYGYEYV
jgi:hypothetical protein